MKNLFVCIFFVCLAVSVVKAGETKAIMKYIASDNREFDSLEECKKHQKRLDFYEELHSKIGNVKRWKVFTHEPNYPLRPYCETYELRNLSLSTLLDLLEEKNLTLKIINK